MIQTESVGNVQDRTAEVSELGEKVACHGGEGGSKVKNILHLNIGSLQALTSLCMTKTHSF